MKIQKITIVNHKKEKIVGEFFKNNSQKIIIVCHGLEYINNFGDDALQKTLDNYFFTLKDESNASIFSFDFRGHGESDGKKEISLKKRSEDIRTVIDYFSSQYTDIVLYGFSFGAMSVAIEASKDIRVKKLVFINGFFSFDIKQLNFTQFKNIILYSFFHPSFIMEIFYWQTHFHSKDIKIPSLVVCAEKDSVVGSLQSKHFYMKLRAPKKLVVFQTNDHMLQTELVRLPREVGKWVRE